mmetsp:Transcript_12089/g.29227  ORF Transcript_12089/g.29227 Transcript_12089/m.29227 type:complete len:121 (+) Transcript_12089:778-1140(+)
MSDYGMATASKSKEKGWLQIQGENKQTLHMDLGGGSLGDILGDGFGDQMKVDGKRIIGYCSTILEEREDLLIDALRTGVIDTDGNTQAEVAAAVTGVLCKWEKKKKNSPCAMDEEGRIEL